MKKLLVMMLLLYPLSALAGTYQWTDERGTVNFAEDLGKVPKKYRKKAKLLDGEVSGTPQITVTGEPTSGTPKGEGAKKVKKLYGGKDENAWRNEFRAAANNRQQAETELAELQGRLSDTSKMSRTEYLTLQHTKKHIENRIQLLQKKHDQLRESADRLGVPMELRSSATGAGN